jgi:hypothetical protein
MASKTTASNALAPMRVTTIVGTVKIRQKRVENRERYGSPGVYLIPSEKGFRK